MPKQQDDGLQKEQKSKKLKRRKHGEGTITERKDGRFEAQITLENGERKSYYRKTYKEAEAALQEARRELKQGTLATGPQQKLKTYLEQWLEEVHKRTIRLGTYVFYQSILNNHIYPSLGHIQLQKLTAQRLQSFYNSKLNEKLSPSFIRSMHSILHSALDNAVRWKLISHNVSDDVSLPQRVSYEVQTLTPEQAKNFLTFIQGHELETLVTLALTTGMRHGEMTALRWSDINFEDSSLFVRRTVKRLGRYKFVEGEPKTDKSKRMIVLPSLTLEKLREHRIRQEEARLKVGPTWQNRDLVFGNTVGGFQYPHHLLRKFHKLTDAAGLPRMRLHDLRHSAATLLLTMGVSAKVVQEILGHSNIGTTMNTYTHVQPAMQKEAMDKIDNLFGEQKS